MYSRHIDDESWLKPVAELRKSVLRSFTISPAVIKGIPIYEKFLLKLSLAVGCFVSCEPVICEIELGKL